MYQCLSETKITLDLTLNTERRKYWEEGEEKGNEDNGSLK